MYIKNKKTSQSVRQKAKKDQKIGVAEKVFFPLPPPPTFARNVGGQMDSLGCFFFCFLSWRKGRARFSKENQACLGSFCGFGIENKKPD